MDPQPQASFIPKKSLIAKSGTHTSNIGILWLISVLLFVVSLFAAGAVFAFEQYLQGDITNKTDSLTKAQASYDPSSINELIRLDERLTQARTLLGNHISSSAIFALLENLTLQTVRFSSFGYDQGTGGLATLDLTGEALDFSSVALQSDSFASSRLLKDVIFSDVQVDSVTGHISFKVRAQINPSVLLYRNSVTGSVASSTTQSASPEAGSSTSAGTP